MSEQDQTDVERLEAARHLQTYRIDGAYLPRIAYGDEQRFGADWHAEVTRQAGRRCHDCNASPGTLHMPGCDMEECPNCGGQAFACDCDYQEQDGLHPFDWRIY